MGMQPLFFRPGQQLRSFDVYRKRVNEDEDELRETFAADPERIETIRGTIVQASQSEQFQWGQMGHPITHRIVVRGRILAQATDEVRTEDGRVWSVQSKHDPVELGFFSTLYCEEKLGVSGK